MFFCFGCAFSQTDDIKEQTKKNTQLVVQQPVASMLNQEVSNKGLYASIAKKPIVIYEAIPIKSEDINEEATKKKSL